MRGAADDVSRTPVWKQGGLCGWGDRGARPDGNHQGPALQPAASMNEWMRAGQWGLASFPLEINFSAASAFALCTIVVVLCASSVPSRNAGCGLTLCAQQLWASSWGSMQFSPVIPHQSARPRCIFGLCCDAYRCPRVICVTSRFADLRLSARWAPSRAAWRWSKSY